MVLRQQILLTNVPTGTGHVVFSADDFGNFLVHPLMGDAVRSAVQVGRQQPQRCSNLSLHACASHIAVFTS